MDGSKTRFLIFGFLIVGLGVVLGTALWLKLAPNARFSMLNSAADERLQIYGSVPEFALTERNGDPVQHSGRRVARTVGETTYQAWAA